MGAFETGRGGESYPIGDENLTWVEMLTRLGHACGKSIKVVTLPTWLLSFASWIIWMSRALQGREGGLDMRYFAPLQTAQLFIDPAPAQTILGFHTGGLDQAFAATVSAVR